MKIASSFHNKIKFSICNLFVLLSLFTSIHANTATTEKRISLQVKQKPLHEVFASITEQTSYRFSYSPKVIDTQKKVSLHVKNKNIDETLKLLLPNSVTYKKTGKHIIISTKAIADETVSEQIKVEEKKEETELVEKKKEKNEQYNQLKYNDNEINLKKIAIPCNGIIVTDCHNDVNLKNEQEMKKYFASLLIIASTATAQMSAQESTIGDFIKPKKEYQEAPAAEFENPIQISFIYPVGTGGIKSYEKTYNFSLNILGGITGRTKGIELASLFNINKYSADGVQMAGFFNYTGFDHRYNEKSNNLQLASVFNYTKAGNSAQFSGVLNFADNGIVQATSVANIASESKFQVSGVINYATTADVQIAGVFNTSSKSRFQVAGIGNFAKEGDVQIGGVLNVAKNSSCQIGSILNVTKAGGFQLGIVNVRDTADGVSLGLLNIVKRGGVMEFGIEGGEFIHTAATFRSGTEKLYSILSVGLNYKDNYWMTGAGLGTSFKFTNWLGVNLELMQYHIYDSENAWKNYNGLTQLRPLLNVKLADHFKVFLGPTLNILVQPTSVESSLKTPTSLWETQGNFNTVSGWIGFTGGIKF